MSLEEEVKRLSKTVERLEKRLREYESVYGTDLDRKLRERETKLRNLRISLTPESELTEEERRLKDFQEHYEKQLRNLELYKYRAMRIYEP